MPRRIAAAWSAPADMSMLAALRIAIGSVLAWELWRYLDLDYPRRYYVDVPMHFTFWPFDWIRPPSEVGLTWLFIGLSLAAALVAVGAFFRSACLVLGVGMAYIFLLDRSFYLNHWYLATILVFLLALTPANAAWSIDARSGAVARRTTVPGWTIWMFRFQVGIVYFFAGLSKIDPDWLAGRPMRIWLDGEGDFPVIGRWIVTSWAAAGMSVAAMIFDVVVVGLLLSRRTRRFAYVVALGFHLMNSRIFTIGMFPWAMMLVTASFFPTDFPRHLVQDLRAGVRRLPTIGGALVIGVAAWLPEKFSFFTTIAGTVAGAIAGYHLGGGEDRAEPIEPEPIEPDAEPVAAGPGPWLRRLLVAWIVIQLLLPLRPYLFPGNASWTEEGQQFAWRLLLRTKSGTVRFEVTDPVAGETVRVNTEEILSGGQLNNIGEQPDMMVQFANYLEREYRPSMGGHDLEVRAISSISLNGHRRGPLVDPTVDLTKVSRPWFPPADWIMPQPDD